MRQQLMRVNESGSIISFIVIGLVLAALVVGGVYAVQQRKDHTTTPVAVKSSPSVTKSTAPSPSVTPAPKPQPSSSAPSASKPVPTVSRSPVTPKPTPIAVVPHTSTAPLPKTGPSDDILSVIMLASFVGMTVAYTRSIMVRRQLFNLVD